MLLAKKANAKTRSNEEIERKLKMLKLLSKTFVVRSNLDSTNTKR